jgi:four helix bundle suffix protein
MSNKSNQSDCLGILTATPEVAANVILCFANQASYLLWKQLQKLEQDFLNQGGFTEKLYRERQKRRYNG